MTEIKVEDLKYFADAFVLIDKQIPVIEALDGQLITNKIFAKPNIINNELLSDVENDILKIVVVNRYNKCACCKSIY